jgi:hypothetical protein
MAWLDQQWNVPSRSDNYLMQIAQEVKRVLHRDPNKVTLDEFKLEFNSKKNLNESEDSRYLDSGYIEQQKALFDLVLGGGSKKIKAKRQKYLAMARERRLKKHQSSE